MGGGEVESLVFELGMPGFRFTRMLKNAPAYRQAGMCGVALIFTLLDKVLQTRRWSKTYLLPRSMRNKVYTHLTGQVVAAYSSSRERIYAFPTKDVERLRERDFTF